MNNIFFRLILFFSPFTLFSAFYPFFRFSAFYPFFRLLPFFPPFTLLPFFPPFTLFSAFPPFTLFPLFRLLPFFPLFRLLPFFRFSAFYPFFRFSVSVFPFLRFTLTPYNTVPKFYLTCKLKPRKGLRICTSSLTIACHGRPATRGSNPTHLNHTELISRYTDPANYDAQYTGEQYLPFFPAFPRVLFKCKIQSYQCYSKHLLNQPK